MLREGGLISDLSAEEVRKVAFSKGKEALRLKSCKMRERYRSCRRTQPPCLITLVGSLERATSILAGGYESPPAGRAAEEFRRGGRESEGDRL